MDNISEKMQKFHENFVFGRVVGKNKNFIYTWDIMSGGVRAPKLENFFNNFIKKRKIQN